MKFENIKVYNFENAFRGMRNPMNSWNKSDSWFGITNIWDVNQLDDIASAWTSLKYPNWEQEYPTNRDAERCFEHYIDWLLKNGTLEEGPNDTFLSAFIGPEDLFLAQHLIKAGSEHRKFMRQIFVSVDITAPLYFYKELDTYKVGTVSNSTSTMHKLASTPITLKCFETDDFNPDLIYYKQEGDTFTPAGENSIKQLSEFFIEQLEFLRQKYNETKDKRYWKELIRWLPESWLQTRTWTCNYENLLGICSKGQRRNHKLTEWSDAFMSFARGLPYAQELIFLDEIS